MASGKAKRIKCYIRTATGVYKLLAVFDSMNAAAEALDISVSTVHNSVTNKTPVKDRRYAFIELKEQGGESMACKGKGGKKGNGK